MNPRIGDPSESWDATLLAQFDVDDEDPAEYWPVIAVCEVENGQIDEPPVLSAAALGGTATLVVLCAGVLVPAAPREDPPVPAVVSIDLTAPIETEHRVTRVIDTVPAPKKVERPPTEERSVVRPTDREPVAPIPAGPPRRRALPVDGDEEDWRPGAATSSAAGAAASPRSARRRGEAEDGLAPSWEPDPEAFDQGGARVEAAGSTRSRRGNLDAGQGESRGGGEHGTVASGDLWDVVDAARLGSPAGGTLNPAREAELMASLLDRWPLVSGPTTRSGWRMDARPARFCMWEPASGDLICLEPRGARFIEVYVAHSRGGAISYTREEALRRATEVTR